MTERKGIVLKMIKGNENLRREFLLGLALGTFTNIFLCLAVNFLLQYVRFVDGGSVGETLEFLLNVMAVFSTVCYGLFVLVTTIYFKATLSQYFSKAKDVIAFKIDLAESPEVVSTAFFLEYASPLILGQLSSSIVSLIVYTLAFYSVSGWMQEDFIVPVVMGIIMAFRMVLYLITIGLHFWSIHTKIKKLF